MNPDWQIHVLDETSAGEFVDPFAVPEDKLSKLSLAHRSDLLRTQLLINHGGVWIDGTVFVTQSFEQWLPSKLDAGLFLFSRPGRDRLIANWFIASVPQHPVLIHLYDALCEFWSNNDFRNLGRKPNSFERLLHRSINRNLDWPNFWFSWPARKILRIAPYMVYHYLYGRLVSKNRELQTSYGEMPIVSADGPHRLQRIGLNSRFGSEAERVLENTEIPLHKLTYKTESGGIEPGSVIEHILHIADNQLARPCGQS